MAEGPTLQQLADAVIAYGRQERRDGETGSGAAFGMLAQLQMMLAQYQPAAERGAPSPGPIGGRRVALELAIGSSAGANTAQIVRRAREFEQYLRTAALERPHHACREPECATPSGKIACHTCGEAWPCSTNMRENA